MKISVKQVTMIDSNGSCLVMAADKDARTLTMSVEHPGKDFLVQTKADFDFLMMHMRRLNDFARSL